MNYIIPDNDMTDEEFDVYLAAEMDRICEKGRLAKRWGGGSFFVNDFRPKPSRILVRIF